MPRAANISDWGALFALTLMWGSSFALNEVALQSVTPSALVAVRVIIGAFVMFTFMRASGVRLPQTARGWLPRVIMAVAINYRPQTAFHLFFKRLVVLMAQKSTRCVHRAIC